MNQIKLFISALLIHSCCYAFEDNEFTNYQFNREMYSLNTTKPDLDQSYFYFNEDKVNYPQFKTRREVMPSANVAGFRINNGILDITDSSHMFFTFDGAVFIIDY
jgi:hypothetical protein